MFRIFIVVSFLLTSFLSYGQKNSGEKLLKKMKPHNIKIQHAGNIGMFSIGAGYTAKDTKWKGDAYYGFVPSKFADSSIHSMSIKGQYSSFKRGYTNGTHVDFLNVGLMFNYTFGEKYFTSLPGYYDSGYYYFPTALNIGVFAGSEIRWDKWGLYYELGTTEKRIINFVKSPHSIRFTELWSLGLGVVFHLR